MRLVEVIIPYYMSTNTESEACDLAMETERIDLLEAGVDAKASDRVCLCVVPHSHSFRIAVGAGRDVRFTHRSFCFVFVFHCVVPQTLW
jgi:hypothetical protein